MRAKGLWTIQSFLTCFFWNAVLVGVLYYFAVEVLKGIDIWLAHINAAQAAGSPEDISAAARNLSDFLGDIQPYLLPVMAGVGAIVTFFLWLFVLFQGRGVANRYHRQTVERAPALAPEAVEAEPEKRETAERRYTQASPQAAVQMLSVLQREGRLIDFLQEDLSQYDDAQIGAAVRSIHQGCKQAVTEYVDLEPIYQEAEGNEVTVPTGFDSKAIRLTGDVTGAPPFSGILRHRGWRVAAVKLPQPTTEQAKDWVLAPAEVEIAERKD